MEAAVQTEQVLSLSGVSCAIGVTTIVSQVDFQIAAGEIVGVIGPNGSGKTTLFNCVCGFVPASTGRIHLFGNDVTDNSPSRRAQTGLGRVFQNPGIFREMSVLENMLVALEGRDGWWRTLLPWGSRSRTQRQEALRWLGECGLAGRANEKAGQLSGGQLRLLEMVRSSAFGARVLLLDEPTAGVSPKMKDEVSRLILKLRDEGKSLVIVEHDINFIAELCSRVIVLNQGSIVFSGTPAEVKQSPLVRELYLGKAAA